jgi:hypothetical protein
MAAADKAYPIEAIRRLVLAVNISEQVYACDNS